MPPRQKCRALDRQLGVEGPAANRCEFRRSRDRAIELAHVVGAESRQSLRRELYRQEFFRAARNCSKSLCFAMRGFVISICVVIALAIHLNCMTRFCEGRFHESIVVSDCQSPLLLFDEEGACTCRRDGTHALRPGRYQFSALDAGFTFTASWPRPVRPLPPRGAWAGETHDDRLPLLAAGAGPFPFTPRCLDDRPDLARPAGKKRGTGLFYARTLGFPA